MDGDDLLRERRDQSGASAPHRWVRHRHESTAGENGTLSFFFRVMRPR
jgi:hypothetical protein